MRICELHWDKLRNGVAVRGLMKFVGTAEEAANQLVESPTEKPYDPLLTVNNMIWDVAIQIGGLYLLSPDDNGQEICPVCEAIANGAEEHEWIDAPLDSLRDEFIAKGWIAR